MGREKRPCQGKKHFSHPHFLKHINQAESETLTCNACEKPKVVTNKPNFYGCNSCQYFLHEDCLNAPRFLDHSSHPSHHLTLLPVPTYSDCSFTCNACGTAGNGFSFSCARCDFDLHMQCALLPQTVFLTQHHHHELELIFEPPFDDYADESTVFVCDLCHDNADLNYWLYYCAECDFGAHLGCAISKSISQQESKQLVNKSRANPVVIRKIKKEPDKIQENNQIEKDEKAKEEDEEVEDEEEEEEEDEEEEEEEEEEDEDEHEEEEEEEKDEDEEEEETEGEEEEEDDDKDEKEKDGKFQNPRSILIDKHPHELKLYFGSPYEDNDILFVCDICNIIMDPDESLYYCADCDFGSHLQCACPDADAIPKSKQRRNNINANSAIEMINSVSDDHDRLIAAQIESQIAARSRQAILDLWDDGPSRKYYYH